MLTTEWNWDTAKEVWQEEAREEGLSQGREEEREEILKLFEQGLSVDEIKQQLRR
jgi:DNA-binding NarL/FixJ family response regulator